MGAGTALAGLAAWQLGGRVTITDLEENLHLPRTSVELNSPTKECPVERVGITSLDWLSQSDPERLVAERGRADTIIAADVLWLEDLVDDFARCLRTICTAETTVVLAYQERATTITDRFFAGVRPWFDWRAIPSSEHHPEYHHPIIQIYEMHLKEDAHSK
mmetsp:Transcript_20006/g.47712  ORF Transcript_20006/g.47712 Transcript_20006/m.47712 type:complete len:161 (+) Transcript_20006:297-779(+)